MTSNSKTRRYINLPSHNAALPFSDAVLAGDTLYVAGRIGVDPGTGKVPADVDDELNLLFEDFKSVLEQAGMTFDDLVWVQVFSPDLSLWERFNQEYIKHFSRDRLPARAFLGSAPLLLNGRFEMMGVALKSSY